MAFFRLTISYYHRQIMDRKAFHNLLKNYLDRKCTDDEKAIIEKWYELLDDADIQLPADDDLTAIENRLWNKIQHEIEPAVVPARSRSRVMQFFIGQKWAVAAAMLVVVLALYMIVPPNRGTTSLENEKALQGLVEQQNMDAVAKIITLEDGSRVTLKKDAKIAFPRHFAQNKREVYLEGEAFFEVSKNPARPFFVYNNNLVTEVLGTSFNVKIINNKIEVAVRTGRVAVYENGNRIALSPREKLQNGVIITPNQKVTYYTETRHFITSIVDMPLPVAQVSKGDDSVSFVYDDTPLGNVLSGIEKVYNIEVVLENEGLKNCPFTGDITKPSLYNKLEFICQAFGASYEIKGTKILITGGNGCN